MAEQPPNSPNPPTRSLAGRHRVKTPAGVWVVVGLGVFFVLTALGISAYIVLKALGERGPQSASPTAMVTPAPTSASTAPSGSDISPAMVGVDMGLNTRSGSKSDDTMTPPPVVANAQEEDETRQEVLKRIDLMPGLSQKDKDQLYAQVERARAFSKLAIVPFTTGKTSPGASQIEELMKRLQRPDLKTLVSDPTVVLVMVGYADKQGDPVKNMEISRTRAEGVVKELKDKLNLVNMLHAVGLGSQDLFDKASLEKNRIVEVWAVQP